jgi:hypothetical protein
MSARQQQAQTALAMKEAATNRAAGMRQNVAQAKMAAPLDLVNQGLAQKAAINQQVLGGNIASGSQDKGTESGLLSQVMTMGQQNTQFYDKLAQDAQLAQQQLGQQQQQFDYNTGWEALLKQMAGGAVSGGSAAATKVLIGA